MYQRLKENYFITYLHYILLLNYFFYKSNETKTILLRLFLETFLYIIKIAETTSDTSLPIIKHLRFMDG